MSTVRERIIDAIVTAIGGIGGIGAVIDAGRRDDGAGQEIVTALANETYAVELALLDDDRDEPGSSYQIEAVRMQVVAIVHMPTVLPDGLQPYQAAARIHELIRKLYAVDGSWGGLAVSTTNLGGGGVGIHEDMGTVCTASVFEIMYRYLLADGEVAQ